MTDLKEIINIRNLASRYYKKTKPEKNYTPEQASKQWHQDNKKDMRVMRACVAEMWKEVKEIVFNEE